MIESDFQSTESRQASTAQTSVNDTAALSIPTANVFVPTGQSQKLYFHCFAVEVLDYCSLKIIRGEYDTALCQEQSLNYCAISCTNECQAFILYVRDNLSEALIGVQSLAVRLHFGILQARYPEIPDLTEGQLNACELLCRSSWRAALYHYLNTNYKRYPECWLRTFTPADLDNVPTPVSLYVNAGTGAPYSISSKTGKKKIGCGEQRSD